MPAAYLQIWFWKYPNKYILVNNTGALKCINLHNDMTYLYMYVQWYIPVEYIGPQTRLMFNIRTKGFNSAYIKKH